MYHDNRVSDLYGMFPWLQVPEHCQLGGVSNLHPGAQAAGTLYCLRQDEPFQTRGVHHRDILHPGVADLDAPEAVADEVEVHALRASLDVEDLQDGAPGDDGVDVPVLHFDAAEAELPEVGEGDAAEAGRVRELPEADVEAGEGGDGEDHAREGHIGRPRAIDEDELLDALGGEETEPAPEVGLARTHAVVDEVDAAEGPRVRGEDAGDGSDDGGVVGGGPGAAGEVGIDEDERRRAPDPAPARSEHGGTGGVLGREARNDVAEEPLGETADAIDAVGGGREAGGEVGVGVDGRVREIGVDDRHELLHRQVQLVRIAALAPRFLLRLRVEVGERWPAPARHGRKVSTSRLGVFSLVWTTE